MTKIETVANDIAMMSNASLADLAQEMIRHYPNRAEALTTFLTVYEQEQMRSIKEELGIA
jgi:hypothetical protein